MITISDKKTYGDFEKFTINIDGISISGCSYKVGTSAKGPVEFIALPQHKITLRSGNEKWVGDVSLSREVSDQVLEAYKQDTGIVSRDGVQKFDVNSEIPF